MKIYITGFAFVLILFSSCIKPGTEIAQYEVVSKCKLPGYSKDFDFQGDYLFVANDQGGLQVVDISNLREMRIIGSYPTQRRFVGVAVRGNYAYVASLDLGDLKVFNVSNPATPELLGEDGGWFSGYGVKAPIGDTGYAYVAAGYWFIAEDVRNLSFPSYRRRYAVSGNVRNVFMLDYLAFLACEQVGLYIYNVNRSSTEALVSNIDTPGNARDVFVWGNYAYVADGLAGLCIVDISRLDSLRIVSRFDTKGYSQGVWVENGLCYIADREGGMVVLEVSDPSNPKLYGIYKTPYSYKVKVRDGCIFLADRDEGIVVLKEVKE